MREIVSVVSEPLIRAGAATDMPLLGSDSTEVGDTQQNARYDLALQLLADIASGPFRQLLVPCFTRVLTFQCGLRARLVSGGILARSTFAADLASGRRNYSPILHLLDQFQSITSAYSDLLSGVLSKALSSAALTATTSRVAATVDRCGVTQVANDLIECVLAEDHLRYELFAQFLGTDRFGSSCVKLRKILAYLFRSASRPVALKFQGLFEGGLMKQELSRLEWSPRIDERGVLCPAWATELVSNVAQLFETAQSVARMELAGLSQCLLSAERALACCFAELSEESVGAFAKALAVTLDALLRRDSSTGSTPPTKRESLLKSVTAVHKVHLRSSVCMLREVTLFAALQVIMSERLLYHFQPAYEALLAERLLHADSVALQTERFMLGALPVMPAAVRMLQDMSQTSIVSDEFSLYLMDAVDSDRVAYCPAVKLALQSRAVTVNVLCQHTWHKRTAARWFSSLTLPAPLLELQSHFAAYYQTRQPAATDGAGRRRLSWCRGAGEVVLSAHARGSRRLDLRVTEPQAALLYAFNTGCKHKTVASLCFALNLSLEELRAVVLSLSGTDMPVPLLKVTCNTIGCAQIGMDATVSLCDDLATLRSGAEVNLARDFGKYMHVADRNSVNDWHKEVVDACIVRVLKDAARQKTAVGASAEGNASPRGDGSMVLSAQSLVECIFKELLSAGKCAAVTSADILTRADRLAAQGVIDKVALGALGAEVDRCSASEATHTTIFQVGYTYLANEAHPSIPDDSTAQYALGEELYEQLRELVVERATVPSSSSVVVASASAPTEDEGREAECNDSGESKSERRNSGTFADSSAVVAGTPTVCLPAGGITVEVFERALVGWAASLHPAESTDAVGDASAHHLGSPAVKGTPSGSPTRPGLRPRLNSSFLSSGSPPRFTGGARRNSEGDETKSDADGSRGSPDLRGQLQGSVSLSPSKSPARPTAFPALYGSAAQKHADVDLKDLHAKICHSVCNSLYHVASQLSKLTYQHGVGCQPAHLRADLLTFSPPALDSYLSMLQQRASAASASAALSSVLHRELFSALPPALQSAVWLQFTTAVEGAEASEWQQWRAQWSTPYSVRTESSASAQDSPDYAARSSSEDSKADDTNEAELVSDSTDSAVTPSRTITFEVFVSSLLATADDERGATPTHISGVKADRGGDATVVDMFPLFASSSRGKVNSPTAGLISSHKSRRLRAHRAGRPLSSRGGKRFSGEWAKSSQVARARGGPHHPEPVRSVLTVHGDNNWNFADPSDFDTAFYVPASAEPRFQFPGYVNADDALGSEGNSGPSSRSSSRSNSNGDFSVAQLMHSIEEQLRNTALRPPSPTLSSAGPVQRAGRPATSAAPAITLPAEFMYKQAPTVYMEYLHTDNDKRFEPEPISQPAPVSAQPAQAAGSAGALRRMDYSTFSAALPLRPSLASLVQEYFTHMKHTLSLHCDDPVSLAEQASSPSPGQLTDVCLALLRQISLHAGTRSGSDVQPPERCVWYCDTAHPSCQDLIHSAFTLLDQDRDGLLTVRDFADAAAAISPTPLVDARHNAQKFAGLLSAVDSAEEPQVHVSASQFVQHLQVLYHGQLTECFVKLTFCMLLPRWNDPRGPLVTWLVSLPLSLLNVMPGCWFGGWRLHIGMYPLLC
jgi:hypothetical protein